MRYFFIPFASLITLAAQAQKIDLDIMIGQMIMTGITDYKESIVREQLYEDIDLGKIGGVVLFEKNIPKSNPGEGLSRMIYEIQGKTDIPLLIAIDEEGGKVNRLKPKYGFYKPPSAMRLGEINDTDSTLYYSEKTAATLVSIGINVNFAPVVDVNINTSNPIIGGKGRSFSSDYINVIKHAKAYIKGHDRYRIGTTLKHFPGHGSSQSDTHLGIADVSETWVIEELFPYQELIDEGMAKSVMTSHVVNRALDYQKKPATLSSKTVTDLLRGHLGFEGVVFSDDMQMKAITTHFGFEESIELAINADIDIIIFANNVAEDNIVQAKTIHSTIKTLVNNGKIERSQIEDSYNRVMNFKKELGLLGPDAKGIDIKLQKRSDD